MLKKLDFSPRFPIFILLLTIYFTMNTTLNVPEISVEQSSEAAPQNENLYTLFIEFLDGVYYGGYAEQIAKENPELFTFEWRSFIRMNS